MSGELSLAVLLRTLNTVLDPEVFVFARVDQMPAGVTPRMVFQEAEGITLILTREEADAAGVAGEFPCRMITLNVHSSLEAVGFIAHIAGELARAGMGVNPVSGYYHDHLFVPDGREEEALAILARIAAEA